MGLFIVWSACAMLGAVIAGSKNRSVFGWFLLSLVFGIFAVIAVAALPKLVYGDQLQRHLASFKARE